MYHFTLALINALQTVGYHGGRGSDRSGIRLSAGILPGGGRTFEIWYYQDSLLAEARAISSDYPPEIEEVIEEEVIEEEVIEEQPAKEEADPDLTKKLLELLPVTLAV